MKKLLFVVSAIFMLSVMFVMAADEKPAVAAPAAAAPAAAAPAAAAPAVAAPAVDILAQYGLKKDDGQAADAKELKYTVVDAAKCTILKGVKANDKVTSKMDAGKYMLTLGTETKTFEVKEGKLVEAAAKAPETKDAPKTEMKDAPKTEAKEAPKEEAPKTEPKKEEAKPAAATK